MSGKQRSRWPLAILVVAFLLPFVTAVVLRFGGWQPGQTRNFGDLLNPPVSMEGTQAQNGDGEPWSFVNQEQEWTMLVRSASDCDASCRSALEVLPNVRRSMGRHAGRLHLFHVGKSAEPEMPILQLTGEPPALAEVPPAGIEVWLVDPHGFLVMHYPSGFDPSGLRKDLSRLIR